MFWREEGPRAERNYLSHMLNKNNRLTSKEVEEVVERGKSVNSSFLRLKILPSDSTKPKFAVISPKKVFKKAHQRVGIRRKVYPVIREYMKNIKQNCNVVVFVNKMDQMNHQILKEEVGKLFIKAGLL